MFGDTAPAAAVLKLHPLDAETREIRSGETVRVFNEYGEISVGVEVDAAMRPGVCAMPKGLWRRSIAGGLTANVFAPDDLSDLAGGACFNDARVEVMKARSERR